MIWIHFNACLLLFALLVTGQKMTDFCSFNCRGARHLACDNYGKPGPECPEGVQLVSMLTVKGFILDMHNRLRSTTAGGTRKLNPASRMGTMQWDDDLADMATLKAMTCNKKSDNCIYTESNMYAGQSVALYTYGLEQDNMNIQFLVGSPLTNWLEEGANCTQDIIDSYKSGPAAFFGHFTMAVNERNTRVGCAASSYVQANLNRFLFVCIYKFGNYENYPIYKTGIRAATGCMTGPNRRYPNLCSVHEIYK